MTSFYFFTASVVTLIFIFYLTDFVYNKKKSKFNSVFKTYFRIQACFLIKFSTSNSISTLWSWLTLAMMSKHDNKPSQLTIVSRIFIKHDNCYKAKLALAICYRERIILYLWLDMIFLFIYILFLYKTIYATNHSFTRFHLIIIYIML